MKFDHSKSIPWKLICNDTFSGESSADKSGNDIQQGFYLLWFHTLLESVKDASHNNGKEIVTIPSKGFNFFKLSFEINKKHYFYTLELDKYLNEFYKIKNIIFAGYKGYDFAEDKKVILSRISKADCILYFNGDENKIYEEILSIDKIVNLNIDILDSYTQTMAQKYAVEVNDNDDLTENSSTILDKPSLTDSLNRD